MWSIINKNVKKCLNALTELSYVKWFFLVTSKMMSPNEKNSVIFQTEIILKGVFWTNALIGKK